MTTLTYNEHHLRMMEIIAEREGDEMAAAHENEKTMIELENHFDANYTIFDNDVDAKIIVKSAMEEMGRHDFIALVSRNLHDTTELYEMLSLEGFVTQVNDVYVLSIEYPWLGGDRNELSA